MSRTYINGYIDREDVILLFRDDAGRLMKKVSQAEHVAYLNTKELSEQQRRIVLHHERVIAAHEDGDWLRLNFKSGYWDGNKPNKYTNRNGCWVSYREEVCKEWEKVHAIKTYEADVSPLRRLLSDKNIAIGRPNRCYLDIETDSRVPIMSAIMGKARILSWAIVSDETGEEFSGLLNAETDDDEYRLLLEMWNVLENFDQICAWAGDRFDFPVIKARTKFLDVPVKSVKRWLYMDQMLCFKRNNIMSAESGEEKQSFKLEAIATSLLGFGKHDFDASKTWQAWAAGGTERERLLKYNVQDTALLRLIEKKTGYLELFQTVAETCNVFPDSRGLKPTQQVDGYMLRLGVEKKVHFITKWYGDDKDPEKFAGAYVMPPTCTGIAKNVHVADFASLYPSIMITWNLSPETKAGTSPRPVDGLCHSPSNDLLTKRKEGILPGALNELLELRAEWNKKRASFAPGTPESKEAERRTNGYKTVANSFYGVMGTPYARYYDKQISEATTQNGAWLIKETMKAAESKGMSVIYGDTDSIFVQGITKEGFGEFVDFCNRSLYPTLLSQMGCPVNKIKLAYEKEFERIVFTASKRYCNPPEAPIWMVDGSFKRLGDVATGDKVIGWIDGDKGSAKSTRRRLGVSEVVAVHRHVAPIVKLTMKSGNVIRCTADHRWRYHGRTGTASDYVTPKIGRILAWCKPAKGAKLARSLYRSRFSTPDEIVSIEPDGEGEVIGLTTTTGNYVAWGYASKNCGTYAHYKGKAATAESKPEIKGLEFKRGDVNKIARQMQGEIIQLIVKGCETPESFVEVLDRYKAQVMNDELPISVIAISKAISKELALYVTKKKLDGSESAALPHVQVAQILLERGEDITEGSRVSYIVVDAEESPMKVIPADDYTGECDRFYLWENLVFPPSSRLLAATFPLHDWTPWDRVRPAKVRLKRSQIADPNQTGFSFNTDPGASVVVETSRLVIKGEPIAASFRNRAASSGGTK